MYFTDDSLLPENQPPLMITAAPYGPMWMPGDCKPIHKLPVTWEEQTQAAVDSYNAGATLLHIHVRDPKTGHISKNFKEYSDQIGRLRHAVPKMILQVGGSISFAPEPGEKAEFASYDSRHKLCEIDPKPDQITITVASMLYDHTAINRLDDAWAGTRFTNPRWLRPWPTWWLTQRPTSIWKISSAACNTASSLTSHSATSTVSSAWSA